MPGAEIAGLAEVGEAIPEGGLLRILVEDVTRADAAAAVVAAAAEPTPALRPGDAVPFRLALPGLDPRRRYSLRLHLDRSGSGLVEGGDLVTTRSCPVEPAGASGLRLRLDPA